MRIMEENELRGNMYGALRGVPVEGVAEDRAVKPAEPLGLETGEVFPLNVDMWYISSKEVFSWLKHFHLTILN